MSKLGRKARDKNKVEQANGMRILAYVAAGLLVFAILLGILLN